MLGDEIGEHEKKRLWFLQESGIAKNCTSEENDDTWKTVIFSSGFCTQFQTNPT
jgi:hypothetical protein